MKHKKRQKRFFEFIIIGFLALLLLIITQETPFQISLLKILELKTIDLRFDKRGEINIYDSSDVVILEITKDSYDQIPYSWPWPRFIFANLVENLNQAGAKVIGIDIVMSGNHQEDPESDTLLINSIRNYGNVVVAGKIDTEREQILNNIKLGKLTTNTGVQFKKFENYDNLFYSADSSVGIVNVLNDYDGVHRRYIPAVFSSITNQEVPSFSYAILNKYFNLKKNYTPAKSGRYFNYNNIEIPVIEENSVLINYYSIENSKDFRHVKLIDVLDDKRFKTKDELDFAEDINTWDDQDFRNLFKNKIVLIGSTMPEDKDQFPVSISQDGKVGSNLMYGVKIHATAIQNVLDRTFIFTQPLWLEVLEIICFVFIGFYLSTFFKILKIKHHILIELLNIISIILLLLLFYYIAVQLFSSYNLIITMVSPTLAVLLGYLGSSAYNFIIERQQSILIKGMFSQYVSGALVNELIANPDKLKLGGEKKELSILFSDIAGFSTFSEKMQPDELVTLINEYLSAMTDVVLKNKGTLDKYIGDAVMAFWGAPLPLEDHADRACKSALEMMERLSQLKVEWRSKNIPEINIRIGINTGEVVVGNMGGEQRFDYTVMGDEVNLASRLEGANKQYGSSIMVNESTFQLTKHLYLYRELDNIRVKGKSKPTVVYELIGADNDLECIKKSEKLNLYRDALIEYKNRNFISAAEKFHLSYQNYQDYTSKVYYERCQFYSQNPPQEDWDCVFTMTTK